MTDFLFLFHLKEKNCSYHNVRLCAFLSTVGDECFVFIFTCGSLSCSWQICLDLLTIWWEAEAYLLITACHQTPLVPLWSDCSLLTRWSLQQEQQKQLVNETITFVIIKMSNLPFCNLHWCYQQNISVWAASIYIYIYIKKSLQELWYGHFIGNSISIKTVVKIKRRRTRESIAINRFNHFSWDG